MSNQTFFDKLKEEYALAAPPMEVPSTEVAAFCAWAEKWLTAHPPAGTGFADGTSAIAIRFQDGNQYPLYNSAAAETAQGRSFSITGQQSKAGKGGIVASPSFPITGE